jgi:hypothetical protein
MYIGLGRSVQSRERGHRKHTNQNLIPTEKYQFTGKKMSIISLHTSSLTKTTAQQNCM